MAICCNIFDALRMIFGTGSGKEKGGFDIIGREDVQDFVYISPVSPVIKCQCYDLTGGIAFGDEFGTCRFRMAAERKHAEENQ